jgi:predicted SAM-dependent methyltransferase
LVHRKITNAGVSERQQDRLPLKWAQPTSSEQRVSNVLAISPSKQNARVSRVLHVGCGYPSSHRLHACFRMGEAWEEIRVDVDPKVRPDIVSSIADLSAAVEDDSVDAIWSSHTVEHLYDHEVLPAFAEFQRVINTTGFLLLRCPDLKAIARSLLEHGAEHVAYVSPAGPITPLDMLYGHRLSVAAGSGYMAHHTGFTEDRIGALLLEAAFAEVRTRTDNLDLWTVAFAADADVKHILGRLARSGLNFAAG